MIESKSVFVNGEVVLIPPLALGQSSIYQRYGEFNQVFFVNGTYVVYASETTVFTNDYTIKQGFSNWYMLTYDCILLIM